MSETDTARLSWGEFWADGGDQPACLPGAPDELNRMIRKGWANFSGGLPEGARVIDLACGAGSAAKAVKTARPDLAVSGVDYADLPGGGAIGDVNCLSGVSLDAMPFADGEYGAAISQFGVEYAPGEATAEIDRILAAGAPCRFLVHHSGSVIVEQNRRRMAVLQQLDSDDIWRMAQERDTAMLQKLFDALVGRLGEDPLVLEIASAIRAALPLAEQPRYAELSRLRTGMRREMDLVGAMLAAAMAEGELSDWLSKFGEGFGWDDPQPLEFDGNIICWQVEGRKAG